MKQAKRITVVVDKHRPDKLIPFEYGDSGEIIIVTTGIYNIDDLIVTTKRFDEIDWDNNIVIAKLGEF